MLVLSDEVMYSYAPRVTVGVGVTVDDLVAALGSEDDRVRREARLALARMGHPATPSWGSALANPNSSIRLEATKTLRCLGDPKAAPALVRTLDDDDFDVTWFAAEALIAVGQNAIDPLLRALGKRPPSLGLLDGAHRVLHTLDRQELLPSAVQPVLIAMEGPEPYASTPPAARAALLAMSHQVGPCQPGRTVDGSCYVEEEVKMENAVSD